MTGSVSVTGSKSWTNRALILAATAKGPSTIHNYLRSEDSYWCIESLRTLGAKMDVAPDHVQVIGTGAEWQTAEHIFIGSAGTTARFLTSILAFSVRHPLRVTASEQMYGRPMDGLLSVLTKLGAQPTYEGKPACLPLTLHSPTAPGGQTSMSGALSSQFVSGVLMGSPCAQSPISVDVVDPIVQENYVRMTLAAMSAFGVNIDAANDLSRFAINPQQYSGTEYTIEADASTASYFAALAAVTQGDITIQNLSLTTLQPDIQVLSVFERLGCTISSTPSGVRVIGPEQLNGGFEINLHQCSDTALTIASVAPFASAPIEITGVEHIRNHESDRVAVMTESLRAVGIQVEERRDGWKIYPGVPTSGVLSTHGDHRVAMSLSVLGVAGNGIELLNPACVSKTCPVFFELLRQLGIASHVPPR
ncbi:MAG: 3-phosphoshikimate 1-carboxyvinyltransferase [Myxococcales bacterium]|nr:3-phosphoshikimate 1-carboxyvinyltransferase [Myxococcales bacterium]